jgi:hypothetical protein
VSLLFKTPEEVAQTVVGRGPQLMDKIAKRALAKCKPLFPNRPLELHGHLRPDEILALSKLKEVHPHNQHQVIWAEDYVKNGSMGGMWFYFSINGKFKPIWEKCRQSAKYKSKH